MGVARNYEEQLTALAKRAGLIRPRELRSAGIPRIYLSRLVERGDLLKTGRGLYAHSSATMTENHSFAEVAKLAPKGVICLLSALRFHELTTENPADIWLAVPRGTRNPKVGTLSLRIMQFSGTIMKSGIEWHKIEGVKVPVYSVTKTVADCFRFRNKIGVNIAVEALRDAWQTKKASSEQLWHFAKICRVLNVMRPYFDSLA